MKNKYVLNSFLKSYCSLAAVTFCLCASVPYAHADNHGKKMVDILPPISAADSTAAPKDTTHPIVRLTPDKSELIRLEEEAGSIIIGNPLHINVIADSSTTLVIVPRSPGATHITVLGKTGEVLMQRHVIVASPKENYIRVKKTCLEGDEECTKTSVFYCPDMCHEIGQVDADASADSGSSDDSGGSGGASDDSGDVAPEN